MRISAWFGCLWLILAGIFLGACKKFPVDVSALEAGIEEAFYLAQRYEGPVIARVNGVPISQEEFIRHIEGFPKSYRVHLSTPSFRTSLINNYIQMKLMAELAKRQGMGDDRALRVKWRLQKEAALANAYQEKTKAELTLTDKEVVERYSWIAGPQLEIAASQIVVPTRALAQKAQGLLRSGKSFAAVVRSMSIDRASAAHGGSIEPITPNRGDRQIKQVLASLQDGQVSGIVRVAPGFALIRRDKTRLYKPSNKELEDMRRAVLWMHVKTKVDAAKRSMNIQMDEQALDAAIRAAVADAK